MNRYRAILIGVLPPPVGGTTISFFELSQAAKKHSDLIVFDLGMFRNSFNISKYYRMFVSLLFSKTWSLHMSDRATVIYAPIFFLLSRLLFKRFVYRQFGGEFYETYKSLNFIQRYWLRLTIFKSDKFYVQTKYMFRKFSEIISSERLYWMPTSRENVFSNVKPSFYSNKIIVGFVGRVCNEKGINELINAIRGLDSFELHIYGPCDDEFLIERINNTENVYYFGVAARNDLPAIYSSFSLFALPSYHPGEGYSGALIEALLSGLPVVLTRWRAFPEILPEDSAFYVDIKSSCQLRDVFCRVRDNRDLLVSYGELSRLASRNYDFNEIINKFLESL